MSYIIGEVCSGGTIFYTDGTHGLITTQDNLGNCYWGCQGTFYNINNSSIGAGSGNTQSILNSCSTRPIAASISSGCTVSGYTDWYLPSFEELRLLINNKNENLPNIWGIWDWIYWSSSEYDSGNACVCTSDSSINGITQKSSIYYKNNIRAIRSF